GFAIKTRSPNLYERYTWSYNNSMVMNMNNWVGDGNGYVGNLDLSPEIAKTFSVSGDWHDAAKEQWQVRLTPYYSHVTNYIDAVSCATVGKACPARADGFSNLTLANQTARLYGADLSGKLALGGNDWGRFELRGIVNYVRGKNLDSDDDLYNIMPLNARLALDHRLGAWQNTLESRLVTRKDQVEAVRNERQTPGFALLNYYSSYTFKQAKLDFGIENLFDRKYYDPLGGAYLGQGATMGTDITAGTRVPGMGRSINVGLTLNF
ncbi:partial Heme/hemopexin utilization protein C, partial [uncultured bacterium]